MKLLEYQKLHKELWLWLSENPKALKKDWPGWKKNKKVCGYCFACEAAAKYMNNNCCPIKWTKNHIDLCISGTVINCLCGEYGKWLLSFKTKKAKTIALKIANYDWLTEKECQEIYQKTY